MGLTNKQQKVTRHISATAAISFIALILLVLLNAEPTFAQTPPSTPTPLPETIDGIIPNISIQDLPVPNPAEYERGLFSLRSRTVGVIPQYDALVYTCPSQGKDFAQVLRGPNLDYFSKQEIRETNAYHVLLCRTKGVVDYMILAGSGLVIFFLVWIGINHMIGTASDPNRQGQETTANIARVLVGYSILVMSYLITAVFFYSNLTPYLPYSGN